MLVNLLGRGLQDVRPEVLSVTTDNDPQAVDFEMLLVEEQIVRLKLPHRPAQDLQIIIFTNEARTESLDTIHIRAVARPRVEP